MKVKKLYQAERLPRHMVLETPDGKFFMFYMTPFRPIQAADLTPVPHYYPVGHAGLEATPFQYRMYGLEKEVAGK